MLLIAIHKPHIALYEHVHIGILVLSYIYVKSMS